MEAEKYRLTDNETKECIENVMIELSTLANPSNKPRIEFIVGQPGAGKTGLAAYCKKQYSNNNESILEINSDKIATYHKYYNKLLECLPEVRYKITREFVNPALDIIYDELMKRGINQLVESTFANTDKYRKLMLLAKEHGYEIGVSIMAVDKYESLISCYERELRMMRVGVKPRGIDRENHDKPYINMIDTISELQEYCDTIEIYVRGKLEEEPIRICSSKEDGIDICQSLNKIRGMEHREILENWKEYRQRIDTLINRIQVYGKNPILVENAKKGLEQIKAELNLEIFEEKSL